MDILINNELKKREEIIKTFDKNYLLEAGAGAGKTTIIVERIISHILSNDVDPSSIVAITFTKAASTELAERIQKRALEYLLKESNSITVSRLKGIDKIFTGTIHSFCELILSELPFDANITPGYEIIEDDLDFHTNIWYKFLRDKEDEYEGLTNLLELLNIDYLKLNTSVLLALNNPDINFIGYDTIDYYCIFNDFEEIKAKYKDLKYKDLGKQKSIARLINPLLEEGGQLKDYLNKFNNAFNKDGFIYDIEELFKSLCTSKTKIEEPERFKALIEDLFLLNEKINIVKYNATTDFINMVVKFKKENFNGKLTFNELLYKAYKLIKESDYAREHLKNKYKYFYIDESQDTDPMQAELIMYLTHNNSKDNILSWDDITPSSGSLFVVGDPKQSIYRFRRADISIYNKVKELIQKTGEVVHLDINFRSSDNICKWTEEIFKRSPDNNFGFEEDSTIYQAGFKKILSLWDDTVKKLKDDRNQLNGVYYYDYLEPNDEDYVAGLVKNLIENYYIAEKVILQESNQEGKNYINKPRPIKESDIMLLTKTNKETGIYLNALKKQGISALLSGEKTLGNTREVLNLFFLIDGLLDYNDNIKLIAVLRNSFYLDLETIDLIASSERNLAAYIFNDKKRDLIGHPFLKDAFISLYNMASMMRILNPISFLEMIIEEKTGVFEPDKTYEDIELKDARSSLRQALEILKSKNCNSYYNIREEFKDLIEKEVNNELPLDEYELSNSMRIMNIHKAKGLEANIVILAGGLKKRNASLQSPCHFVSRDNNKNNIGYINYPKTSVGAAGPNEEKNKLIEKEFIEAEIDRLLYVAATRTKTVLIIAKAKGEESFLYPLSSKVDSSNALTNNEYTQDIKEKIKSAQKEKEQSITKNFLINDIISKVNYIKLSPSNFKGNDTDQNIIIAKGSGLKYKHNLYKKDLSQLKGEGRDFGGSIYGTIIHRGIELLMKKTTFLSNCDNGKIDDIAEQSLDEIIDSMELNKANLSKLFYNFSPRGEKILEIKLEKGSEHAKKYLKDELKTYIVETLTKFSKNLDLKDILNDAREIYVEMPFTISLNEDDKLYKTISHLSKIRKDKNSIGKTFLINGTIDLIVKNNDNTWTIIDFKTNKISKSNPRKILKQIYSPQLKAYKDLFERILQEESAKVKDLIIYSTELDDLIYL